MRVEPSPVPLWGGSWTIVRTHTFIQVSKVIHQPSPLLPLVDTKFRENGSQPPPSLSLTGASRRSARLVQRTVRGDEIISRAQRSTATRLCNYYACGDGPSRRVWCRHLGWHPKTEITSPFSRLLSRNKPPLFPPVFIFSECLALGRPTGPVDSFRSPIRLHVVSVLPRTSPPSGSRPRDLLPQEKAIPAPGSPSPSKSSGPYRVHGATRPRRGAG